MITPLLQSQRAAATKATMPLQSSCEIDCTPLGALYVAGTTVHYVSISIFVAVHSFSIKLCSVNYIMQCSNYPPTIHTCSQD